MACNKYLIMSVSVNNAFLSLVGWYDKSLPNNLKRVKNRYSQSIIPTHDDQFSYVQMRH